MIHHRQGLAFRFKARQNLLRIQPHLNESEGDESFYRLSVCFARQTEPMPPSPMTLTSVYRPAMT